MNSYLINYVSPTNGACVDIQTAPDEVTALGQHYRAFPHTVAPVARRIAGVGITREGFWNKVKAGHKPRYVA